MSRDDRGRISELKKGMIELTQYEQQKIDRKNNDQRLRDPGDDNKTSNTYHWIQEGEEEAKRLFEEMMATYFQNLVKDTGLQIQELRKSPLIE